MRTKNTVTYEVDIPGRGWSTEETDDILLFLRAVSGPHADGITVVRDVGHNVTTLRVTVTDSCR